MSDVMIEVDGLTKDYGSMRAVDQVTFSVRKGEVLGFLGPNGAGKSTTMKMLTCYLAPTAGSARVAGHDVFADSLEVRRRNVLHDEDLPHTMPSGMPIDEVSASATMEQAAAALGYDDLRKQQEAWRAEGRWLCGGSLGSLPERAWPRRLCLPS